MQGGQWDTKHWPADWCKATPRPFKRTTPLRGRRTQCLRRAVESMVRRQRIGERWMGIKGGCQHPRHPPLLLVPPLRSWLVQPHWLGHCALTRWRTAHYHTAITLSHWIAASIRISQSHTCLALRSGWRVLEQYQENFQWHYHDSNVSNLFGNLATLSLKWPLSFIRPLQIFSKGPPRAYWFYHQVHHRCQDSLHCIIWLLQMIVS